MKQQVDLILSHGYIITMNESRSIYKDGSIAISGGKIVDVGRHEAIDDGYMASKSVELNGRIVHPGLIDSHVHVAWQLTRSWIPDYFDLNRVYCEFEEAYIQGASAKEEYYGTLLACMEMLLNGTTGFGDTGGSFFIDSVMEAAAVTGIRGCTGALIMDVGMDRPARLSMSLEDCIGKLNYQMGKYPRNANSPVYCNVGLVGLGEASDELMVEAKKIADKNHSILHMHQSYYPPEVAAFREKTGKKAVRHLYDLGVLGPNVSLVHMIHVDEEEREILKKTGTNVVFCPGASLRFGLGASYHGSFPEMLAEGINVGLGTDAGNWSDALDIFRMMYLSTVLFNESRQKVPVISAMQSLEMATINGARILGLDREVGSLEPGKRADIVVHKQGGPEAYPKFDPITNLIFSSQSKFVDTVYVNGEAVVKEGTLVRVDSEKIYREINAAADELSARIGFVPEKLRDIIE